MGLKLYELAPAYKKAIDIVEKMEEDGCSEEDLKQALSLLTMVEDNMEGKVRNIVAYTRTLQAEAAALDAAEKAIAKRRIAKERRVESLRQYLMICMAHAGLKKMEFDEFVVSVRVNPVSVEVTPGTEVAESLLLKSPREPDKAAIKEILVDGGTVPGCRLVRTHSLFIK